MSVKERPIKSDILTAAQEETIEALTAFFRDGTSIDNRGNTAVGTLDNTIGIVTSNSNMKKEFFKGESGPIRIYVNEEGNMSFSVTHILNATNYPEAVDKIPSTKDTNLDSQAILTLLEGSYPQMIVILKKTFPKSGEQTSVVITNTDTDCAAPFKSLEFIPIVEMHGQPSRTIHGNIVVNYLGINPEDQV